MQVVSLCLFVCARALRLPLTAYLLLLVFCVSPVYRKVVGPATVRSSRNAMPPPAMLMRKRPKADPAPPAAPALAKAKVEVKGVGAALSGRMCGDDWSSMGAVCFV